MKTLLRLFVPLGAVLLLAATATACPTCETETGRQVRAGIFNEHFGRNAALTLLPFAVFAGVVAFIYYGPPFRSRPR